MNLYPFTYFYLPCNGSYLSIYFLHLFHIFSKNMTLWRCILCQHRLSAVTVYLYQNRECQQEVNMVYQVISKSWWDSAVDTTEEISLYGLKNGMVYHLRHLWNMGLMWVGSRVWNHWSFIPSSTHVFMEGWCSLSPWKHGAIFMNWTVTEWQSVVSRLRFVGIICGSEIRNLTQEYTFSVLLKEKGRRTQKEKLRVCLY